MHPVRKYDSGPAIVAAMINNAHGGKAKPRDFMPYGKQQEDLEVTGDQLIELLASAKGVKVGR